jgi:hypothetical protein
LVERQDGSLAHAIPIDDEMRAILQHQREKFVARFGREPGPGDRIFFDAPSEEEYDEAVTTAMARAGIHPELIYAYKKTGRLVTDQNRHFVPAASLEAWDAAIEEYRATLLIIVFGLGIAVDGGGKVIVADSFNNRIEEFACPIPPPAPLCGVIPRNRRARTRRGSPPRPANTSAGGATSSSLGLP